MDDDPIVVLVDDYARGATARDVMTEEIHCCREDDDLAKAVRHMEELKVRRLPVINKNKATLTSAASPFASTLCRRSKPMTEALAEKKCTPCRGDLPPLTLAEAEHFRSQTPNWELHDDGHRIERTFRFSNFREALSFVSDVGNLAETEGHHPDVSFGRSYASISLRTKKIKGLHENSISRPLGSSRRTAAGGLRFVRQADRCDLKPGACHFATPL